jgi:hypothetical protein
MTKPIDIFARSLVPNLPFPTSGLGTPILEACPEIVEGLQLPEQQQARACKTWVPKLELGNQRKGSIAE